jgi:hypothetical protein
MPRDYLKSKKTFLLILVFLCFGFQEVLAEPDSEKIRDLLIESKVEEVINLFDKDYIKHKKWNLGEENSYYYSIALLIDGKIDELKIFLKDSQKKYPKSKNLEIVSNQIYYFTQEYQLAKPNPEADLQIKIITSIKNHKAQKEETKIIDEINSIKKNMIYFPTKMDYLIELGSETATNQAKSLAWSTINQNKQKLFPNTLDHYELASAFKTLAVTCAKNNDIKQATKYIKLARENIYKMRSIWLVEDIIVHRPILKINSRSTVFGYAFPQWIMLLRDEYDNYLVEDVP